MSHLNLISTIISLSVSAALHATNTREQGDRRT
jgi:hypothetical protein